MNRLLSFFIFLLVLGVGNTYYKFGQLPEGNFITRAPMLKPEYGYHHNLNEPPIGQYEAVLASEKKLYVLYNYIRELLRVGRYEEALQQVEVLRTIFPDDEKSDIDILLLEIYVRMGLDVYNDCELNIRFQEGDYSWKDNEYFLKAKDSHAAIKSGASNIAIRKPGEPLVTRLRPKSAANFLNGKLSHNKILKRNELKRVEVAPNLIFEDKAIELGLTGESAAGDCLFDDFDNNGFLDLVVSEMKMGGHLKIYYNLGDGKFIDKSVASGLQAINGGMQITQLDFNNDGWLDLYIARGAWMTTNGILPNSLLKNNGDGTFSEVTQEAGLISYYPSQGAIWADFNNDGWLDLFVGNEQMGTIPIFSELYANNGDGTFTNCMRGSGLDFKVGLRGGVILDYNQDGKEDLFLTSMVVGGLLFRNDSDSTTGKIQFTNVSQEILPKQQQKSYLGGTYDFNQDGIQDLIYSTTSKSGFYTLVGKKEGQFKVAEEFSINKLGGKVTGLGIADFDNNGFLDMYVGTDFFAFNRFLFNENGDNFIDATEATGTGYISQSNGIAIGDIDNDGDEDFFCINGGFFPSETACDALFINPGTDNNWIGITLKGSQVNRSAIGVKMELTIRKEDGSKRKIYRTIGKGTSLGGIALRQVIGIAKATIVDKLVVHWSKNNIQTFDKVTINEYYRLKEGDSLTLIKTPL